MRIEYLKYFLCVANSQSITKAASNLHISQQGLSRIIHALEHEFGTELLIRRGNTSVLSPAGRILAKHGEAVVNEFEKLERYMSGYSTPNENNSRQPILIFMTLNAMHNVYPFIHDAVMSVFSHCSISAIEISQDDVLQSVLNDERDNSLYFISAPEHVFTSYAKVSEIKCAPLIDSQMVAMVGKNSRLADKRSLTFNELDSYPLVLRKDSGMIKLLSELGLSGYPEKASLWTSDTKAIESALKASDCATLATSFLSHTSKAESFAFVPIENTFLTPIGFLDRSGRPLNCNAKSIRSYIEDYIYLFYPEASFSKPYLIRKDWVAPRIRPQDSFPQDTLPQAHVRSTLATSENEDAS